MLDRQDSRRTMLAGASALPDRCGALACGVSESFSEIWASITQPGSGSVTGVSGLAGIDGTGGVVASVAPRGGAVNGTAARRAALGPVGLPLTARPRCADGAVRPAAGLPAVTVWAAVGPVIRSA